VPRARVFHPAREQRLRRRPQPVDRVERVPQLERIGERDRVGIEIADKHAQVACNGGDIWSEHVSTL
jgi:hypothetical protein